MSGKIGLDIIMQASVDELNSKYKTIYECAKILGYSDSSFVSRKANQMNLGIRVKRMLLLSPDDIEKIRNSINRREKEDKTEGEDK